VKIGDRVLACLTVRFSANSVPMKIALERFLPRLDAAAEKLRRQFLEQNQDSASQS
jgi:hypothetical protein